MKKQDELPTLDLAALANVTGGAGDDMSAMLPMMMMMRNRAQPAPAAPAPAPWKPKILVNGVEQSLNSTGNGSFATTTDPDDEDF